MTALSKTLADALYNHVLRNTPLTSPTTVYLALHADGGSTPAHPGKTEAGAFANEVDYASYQRQEITFNAPGGTENATGDNSNTIPFPNVDAGETPFEVTGLSLWTAEKGGTAGASGDLLMAGSIDTVKEFDPGDAPLVGQGEIDAAFGEELP